MSDTPETARREEYLDRHHPFIEQGQEPPGRWAPSEKLNGGLAWQGKMGWRTRHGGAIVVWDLGRPKEVQNALYPDGTRGDANNTLDHGFRRRISGDRLWVYGRIDIRPDDVLFIDGDQPVYQPPPQGEVPDLEADLARDPAFLADIKDDRFALAVLQVFENRYFYKGQDQRRWLCGLRQSACLVANLRGRGESYLDYFCDGARQFGTYPDDRPGIERRLRSHIERISRSLTADPPWAGAVRVEDLARLGPGHHSAEEVRRAVEAMRPEIEKRDAAQIGPYREQQRAALEKAQRDLTTFLEDHTNKDVLEALRAHLARLGWRTETEQDRERTHQQWVERAVQVLQEVEKLELRPAAAPEAWAKPLGRQSTFYGHTLEPEQLERMSPDVRAVETGELTQRLRQLAFTGRVTEQEYLALFERCRRPVTLR